MFRATNPPLSASSQSLANFFISLGVSTWHSFQYRKNINYNLHSVCWRERLSGERRKRSISDTRIRELVSGHDFLECHKVNIHHFGEGKERERASEKEKETRISAGLSNTPVNVVVVVSGPHLRPLLLAIQPNSVWLRSPKEFLLVQPILPFQSFFRLVLGAERDNAASKILCWNQNRIKQNPFLFSPHLFFSMLMTQHIFSVFCPPPLAAEPPPTTTTITRKRAYSKEQQQHQNQPSSNHYTFFRSCVCVCIQSSKLDVGPNWWIGAQ